MCFGAGCFEFTSKHPSHLHMKRQRYVTQKALETAGWAQLSVLTWLPADQELAPPTAQTPSATPAAGPWLSLQNCVVPSPHPDQSVSSWCPNTGSLDDYWPVAQPQASGLAPVSLSAAEAAEAPRPGPNSCPAGLAAPPGWVTHQREDTRCVAGSHLLASTDPDGEYSRGIQRLKSDSLNNNFLEKQAHHQWKLSRHQFKNSTLKFRKSIQKGGTKDEYLTSNPICQPSAKDPVWCCMADYPIVGQKTSVLLQLIHSGSETFLLQNDT